MRMDHAVVIGGSLAGLAAAGVLSRRARRVTVLEPRRPPEGVGSIAPQGDAPHLLLPAGAQALEAIFPGLTAELSAAGALTTSSQRLRLWFHGYRARPPGASATPMCSRALLETALRRRVQVTPNVRWVEARAEGLLTRDGRVTGVRLADGEISADLVVDAAGRGSSADAWLAGVGHAPGTIETVGVGIRYLATEIERQPGDADGDDAIFIQNTPPDGLRFGLAFAIEGGRWKVLLGGYFGDAPPETDEGFAAYAASLGAPDVAELIAGRPRLAPFFRYAFPASMRRSGETWPTGFVRLGDSVASFNPVYGQGMSSAALQAERLGRNLDRFRQGPALVRAQVRDAARITGAAWALSTGGDFGYPQTTGRRPLLAALTQGYADRVLRGAVHDIRLAQAAADTLTRLRHPAGMMAPPVMIRALWPRRRRPGAASSVPNSAASPVKWKLPDVAAPAERR